MVGPGQSIQAAVNAASPGDTVLVLPGVYHQSVQIRTDGITLRGSGAFGGGTVLVPPKKFPNTLCNGGFGPTGVCILAKSVNASTGAVLVPVRNDTGLLVSGFPANGVFNTAFRNHPADLIWDGTGVGVRFTGNACGTSLPSGLCH